MKLFLCLPVICLVSVACNFHSLDDVNGDASFFLSTDTVYFDTIVAGKMSPVLNFRIINPSDKSITIESIDIYSSSNTSYNLNVDGSIYDAAQTFSILPHDSIFVFIQAEFAALNEEKAQLVSDKIRIRSDNNKREIKVLAWSQNVNRPQTTLTTNTIWNNTKPYLITDSLIIPYGVRLDVTEGCKLLFSSKAYLKVYGELNISGTLGQNVIVSSDRFDNTVFKKNFEKLPNQWEGFRFYSKSKGRFNHVEIRNSRFGIFTDAINAEIQPVINVDNSIFRYCDHGIVVHGGIINCINSIVSDCNIAVRVQCQGSFNGVHLSISNRSSIHKNPSVYIADFVDADSIRYMGEIQNVSFYNSMITGSLDDEVLVHMLGENLVPFHIVNSALKSKQYEWMQQRFNFTNNVVNKSLGFTNNNTPESFKIDLASPLRNLGNIEFAKFAPLDIYGRSRLNDDAPDIGAIEYYP